MRFSQPHFPFLFVVEAFLKTTVESAPEGYRLLQNSNVQNTLKQIFPHKPIQYT
tara:strand:- start:1442 stop:1603 length:162 start_codon:yes stop_codon:yes gene_type:complete